MAGPSTAHVGRTGAKREGKGLLQIMSLNGWGGKLHDKLLPYLERTAPDILCLQEVVHSPETDKDALTYRDGDHVLPQRANFFRDVSRTLPDHVGVFCPAAQGVLWDGESSVPSQWGLASLVHRSLSIIGQVQEFVHKGYAPWLATAITPGLGVPMGFECTTIDASGASALPICMVCAI